LPVAILSNSLSIFSTLYPVPLSLGPA
jgi:hypothetical protein